MPTDDCEHRYYRVLPADSAGMRVDRALAYCLPEFSRARLQRWLTDGALTVDGTSPPAKARTRGDEVIELLVPAESHASDVAPEPIPLDIVFEDASILVINKPAERVMHPGAGNTTGTLQNALAYYDSRLTRLPRAGIVHRLDKDTTGLFVVARTHSAHQHLVHALAERQLTREYEALVRGQLRAAGTIDAPIGRHRVHRQRMAVTDRGRPAVTHYRVTQNFRRHALMRCTLESGRTHQIRVHMAHRGLPLVGDPVYGRGAQPVAGYSAEVAAALRGFARQALHARRLVLPHPDTGTDTTFQAPRPADLDALIQLMATDQSTES